MKNNKGFTLVELLATITILGILMGVAVMAYTKYIDRSKNQSRKTLAESSANAAEEYFMDHPYDTSVTFETLVDQEYLESDRDPQDNTSKCKGKVTKATTSGGSGKLSTNKYTVVMCCIRYNYTYTFPGGTKKKNSSCDI